MTIGRGAAISLGYRAGAGELFAAKYAGMETLLSYPRAVFAVSLISLWLAGRAGAYVETRWSPLTDEDREHFRTVIGATLTLLGLLVGFSFSMAVGRFEQRKNYEAAEANAIGTEYRRAGLLPPAAADKAKDMLRQYLDLRIRYYVEGSEDTRARIGDDAHRLQNELWQVIEPVAASQPTPIVALVAAGMNNVLDAEGYAQAAWWNRIPTTAWELMAAIAITCCALVGYGSHKARRSMLVILPVVLSTAFFLIADLDTPRHGLIRVRPRDLISLVSGMRTPLP